MSSLRWGGLATNCSRSEGLFSIAGPLFQHSDGLPPITVPQKDPKPRPPPVWGFFFFVP
jgi:hypothetical protein